MFVGVFIFMARRGRGIGIKGRFFHFDIRVALGVLDEKEQMANGHIINISIARNSLDEKNNNHSNGVVNSGLGKLVIERKQCWSLQKTTYRNNLFCFSVKLGKK